MFFGEQLPEKFHDISEKEFDKCDLLIVIGTSLNVKPFKDLPGKFVVFFSRCLKKNLLYFSSILQIFYIKQ